MNTEDFVTYAQAVKLKECGFDWPCYEFWDNSFCLDGTPVKIRKSISEPKICVMSECNSMLDKMGCGLITAPSLSQAAKWLREVKGIYIEVKVRDHNAFETVGKVIDNKTPHLPLPKYLFDLWDYRNPYTTYESALSAGIDAVLRLLITKRQ